MSSLFFVLRKPTPPDPSACSSAFATRQRPCCSSANTFRSFTTIGRKQMTGD